jgi:hypothetical protein
VSSMVVYRNDRDSVVQVAGVARLIAAQVLGHKQEETLIEAVCFAQHTRTGI